MTRTRLVVGFAAVGGGRRLPLLRLWRGKFGRWLSADDGAVQKARFCTQSLGTHLHASRKTRAEQCSTSTREIATWSSHMEGAVGGDRLLSLLPRSYARWNGEFDASRRRRALQSRVRMDVTHDLDTCRGLASLGNDKVGQYF